MNHRQLLTLALCFVSACLFVFVRVSASSGYQPALHQNHASHLISNYQPLQKQNDELNAAAIRILEQNCLTCHGSAQSSGLDLRKREGALRGGTRGPALVPGKSSESLLYKAITGQSADLKMPPGKKELSAADQGTIKQWIDAGAQWPAEQAGVLKSNSAWWSFRKPPRPAVPSVKNSSWVLNEVDAFVLKKLEEQNLKPAPPADKQTLIRRAYLDLLGLPPTPQEIKTFVTDRAPDAYEKLIDKLLASPHYGERWGRHWLDAARYADSGGFEGDLYYPGAWRYRDYVIKSFNDDKPYDVFVQEQVAADELWPDTLELEGSFLVSPQKLAHAQARIGTALYTIGPLDPTAGQDGERYRYEAYSDMVDTTSSLFLGLTVGCARCHDHKFDPLPQRDYYRMQAIFAGSEEKEIPLTDPMRRYLYRMKASPQQLALDDLKAEVRRLDATVKDRFRQKLIAKLTKEEVAAGETPEDKRTPEQASLAKKYDEAIRPLQSKAEVRKEYEPGENEKREKLLREIGEREVGAEKPFETATVLGHSDVIPEIHVAVRGDYKNKGPLVRPGVLSALGGETDLDEPQEHPYVPQRRKALALWLTSPENPLPARVMVNRIWQGHFGRGIVATANDFGHQGELPTHPELLDWLATEFVSRHWSVKAMHRLMMLSNTYRMSDRFDENNIRIDGDNHYLWRMNRRRLEAEIVRDAVLSVAGTLNQKMGGPPVIPPLSEEEAATLDDKSEWPATSDPEAPLRRGLYLYVKRNFRLPLFDIFDTPDNSFSCARRDVTNVAPQALALLNNRFIYQQAQAFAARLVKQYPQQPEQWIENGWQDALGRAPTEIEKQRAAQAFFQDRQNELALSQAPAKTGETAGAKAAEPPRSLVRFCLMLFNLNEFIFID